MSAQNKNYKKYMILFVNLKGNDHLDFIKSLFTLLFEAIH